MGELLGESAWRLSQIKPAKKGRRGGFEAQDTSQKSCLGTAEWLNELCLREAEKTDAMSRCLSSNQVEVWSDYMTLDEGWNFDRSGG